MSNFERGIKAVVAVFALLPGIGVLIDAIAIPPDMKSACGQLILALGFISVVIVFLAGNLIAKLSREMVIVICASLAVVAVADFAYYYVSYDRRFEEVVLPDGSKASFVKPARPSGELARWLESFGGNWDAMVAEKTVERVQDRVNRQNGAEKSLLLLNYLGFFVPLIFAMLIGAWKVGAEPSAD